MTGPKKKQMIGIWSEILEPNLMESFKKDSILGVFMKGAFCRIGMRVNLKCVNQQHRQLDLQVPFSQAIHSTCKIIGGY